MTSSFAWRACRPARSPPLDPAAARARRSCMCRATRRQRSANPHERLRPGRDSGSTRPARIRARREHRLADRVEHLDLHRDGRLRGQVDARHQLRAAGPGLPPRPRRRRGGAGRRRNAAVRARKVDAGTQSTSGRPFASQATAPATAAGAAGRPATLRLRDRCRWVRPRRPRHPLRPWARARRPPQRRRVLGSFDRGQAGGDSSAKA